MNSGQSLLKGGGEVLSVDVVKREGGLLLSRLQTHEADTLFDRALDAAIASTRRNDVLHLCRTIIQLCSCYEHEELLSKYSSKYDELMIEFYRESEARLSLLTSRVELQSKTAALEEELQVYAAQLVTQAELTGRILDELRAIARKITVSDPAIRELKQKLQTLPSKFVDWETFEHHFRKAHPTFLGRLLRRYTDLTAMQVRVCCLLRMGMRTVDIARLFSLSERSVENHRLRIRKQMNLNPGEDLSAHLMAF